jgi:hypothetical protein
MWLINTESIELEFFSDPNIPPYAILSHTWGDQECSFQEFTHGLAKEKSGYIKVIHAIELAKSERQKYIWIDTCTIDKTSSSELSEAINSMYNWYSNSSVCYVYLADVSSQSSDAIDALRNSRWFTRGWTLQELIAPKNLKFYSMEWNFLYHMEAIRYYIHQITRIPMELLWSQKPPLYSYSVAQRMSWASMRQTTRVEDMAYCLMGIFNTNMPLLYGEGNKAFMRLQEEILKGSSDETIFAWTNIDRKAWSVTGLLATSPKSFANSYDVCSLEFIRRDESITVINGGVRAPLWIQRFSSFLDSKYEAYLNCYTAGDPTSRVVIRLISANSLIGVNDHADWVDEYQRHHTHISIESRKLSAIVEAKRKTIFVRNETADYTVSKNPTLGKYQFIKVRNFTKYEISAFPSDGWDMRNHCFACVTSRRPDGRYSKQEKMCGVLLTHSDRNNSDCYLAIVGSNGSNGVCRILKIGQDSIPIEVWNRYEMTGSERPFDMAGGISTQLFDESGAPASITVLVIS